MDTNNPKPTLYKVPVYECRLRQSRRPLQLAEPTLEHSDQSARTLHALLGLTDREHFAALFINGLNRITGAHIVAIGSQHGIAGLEARTVFRAAIVACASAVVLGHNHPSGSPSPSSEDIATTAKLMQAGRVLGLPVIDHVIVTRESRLYHSMLVNGTLPTLPDE
jgi:DNA repair protein RadC